MQVSIRRIGPSGIDAPRGRSTISRRLWRYGVDGLVAAAVTVGIASAALADTHLLWKRQLGTPSDDGATGVATDASGNVVITGSTLGSLGGANRGERDAWVAKYDADGHLLWKRQLGSGYVWSIDESNGVAADRSGNVVITGHTEGGLPGSAAGEGAFVAKYDAEGRRLWTRLLSLGSITYALGVTTDSGGNVVIAGATDGTLQGDRDALVAKYDGDGALLWKQQLGSSAEDAWQDVAVDGDGNIVLAGYIDLAPPASSHDAWVAKYDRDGGLLWKRRLGTSMGDYSAGVAVDGSGNVFITGTSYGSLGGPSRGEADAWVAKCDAQGNLLWKRQLGTVFEDWSYGAAADSNGNVVIAGYTSGALGGPDRGGSDAWMAKYDADGHLVWKRQLGTELDDSAGAVATDGNDNVVISGGTLGSLGGPNRGEADAFIAKFSDD